MSSPNAQDHRITAENFDDVYVRLLGRLNHGTVSTTRKGKKITELFDSSFMFTDTLQCLALCRNLSIAYLEKEFDFYINGSDKLEDAVALSPFWKNCSDDGKTVNSNYGKLIFHDKNTKGHTQFEHAFSCLVNNPQSKKAVMTLYNNDHAYISNDNPCTMFLQVRIVNDRLNMSVYMRSSDVYYGLPYDVPWFVFVQHYLVYALKESFPGQFKNLLTGSYTHHACTFHKYEYKEKELESAINFYNKYDNAIYSRSALELFAELILESKNKLDQVLGWTAPSIHHDRMNDAWKVAANSPCLKKKVGANLVFPDDKHYVFYGSPAFNCKTCVRDNNDDKYFGDECPSVHAEMKCIVHALQYGKNLKGAIMYTTHGPCDACLKLCDLVGVKTVYYDKPYKTDYSHWPCVTVKQLKGYERPF